ncbi:unnamed protein product [Brachionus calyciflorus]|uniref:Uncharacterized protein n=1 Tax=Brachionus calyciflorus TaxID=104777 RepID=A0A814SN47_9BILA|nr:unnamed protein product [Brachionus calyciflorus]
MAIEKSQQLSKLLRKLSAYAAKHKNSINSSKFFIQKKARLKMENKTRWSSSFMILDSFHKALKKQAFPPDDPCPINLDVLELYLQILQPAFQFNLIMQKSKSSIADVLPALNIMLSKWNRMQVTGNYRELCDYLIAAFKHKFKDEINSSVYCVASLLNVSKLTWITRQDCLNMKKNALENLVEVTKQITHKKSRQNSNEHGRLNETLVSSVTVDSLAECMRDDDYLSDNEVGNEISTYEIEKEKILFIQKVLDNNLIKYKSNAKFWV